MSRPCSIFEYKGKWCGVSLELGSKGVDSLEFFGNSSLDELNALFGSGHCGVSIDSAKAYLLHLQFPFSGRRRLGLVVRAELEEYFPFPLEEMSIDFIEAGKGSVLVAAAQRTIAEKANWGGHVRIVTVNSLAILHALRQLKRITRKNFVFLHVTGNTAVMMAFRGEKLYSVRQLIYSQDAAAILGAVKEYKNDEEGAPEVFYVMGDDEVLPAIKEAVGNAAALPVESPSLKDYVKGGYVPECAWIGVGAALIAHAQKNQINLAGQGYQVFPEFERKTIVICAACIAVGLVLLGMSYLDLWLKETAYRSLALAESVVYRAAFPKAPPVKEIEKAFEDKIKAMEKDQSGSVAAVAVSPLAVLAELSSKIDNQADVKINEYVHDGVEVSISGTTVSFAAAEKIKGMMAQVKGLQSVEFQSIDLAQGNQVKFKIKGKL
jgi:hypothetical protein